MPSVKFLMADKNIVFFMGFKNVEVESVKKIDTTSWDSEVIIRAYKNKKLYSYYYVSLIDGGWKVLNRKPNERATK